MSSQQRGVTKKLFPLYEGPYVVTREVRKNEYLVTDADGRIKGVHNARNLRPHREAKRNRGEWEIENGNDSDETTTTRSKTTTDESEEENENQEMEAQGLRRQRWYTNLQEYFENRLN